MNAPIFYVGGSKGGVGKSMVTSALIDYLSTREKNILLLETDNANPDVYKAHKETQIGGLRPPQPPESAPGEARQRPQHENAALICKMVNLGFAEGWIELVNYCDENPGHVAVINSAARSNTGMEKYGATLKETPTELQRNFTAFWVINRQRDSIELLRAFLDVFPEALVYVCRNLYFGEMDKFELYNESKTRKVIEQNGMTLDFPFLANRVADKLYSGRLTIQNALVDLPLGDRAELKRWRTICGEMFDSVLEGKL